MANDSDAFLREIAKNETVQKLSNRMGISRPTFYKYMDLYTEGRKSEIPERHRAFLDNLVHPEIDGNPLTYEESLKKEYADKCEEFAAISDNIEKLEKDLEGISHQHGPKTQYCGGDYSITRSSDHIYKECDSKIFDMDTKRQVLYDEICELIYKIQKFDSSFEPIDLDYEPVFKLKSRSYSDGSKCMVVFEDTGDDYSSQSLALYVKMGDDYVHLGDYEMEEDRNFFIIDDVVLTAPLYYRIESTQMYDKDYENSSGMCKLIP